MAIAAADIQGIQKPGPRRALFITIGVTSLIVSCASPWESGDFFQEALARAFRQRMLLDRYSQQGKIATDLSQLGAARGAALQVRPDGCRLLYRETLHRIGS